MVSWVMMCWFGCRDSKIRGFPKPLIARSCEDASMRRLSLPLPCFCLVGPMGPSASSLHRAQECPAFPQCHFRGWETLSSPSLTRHRVQHQLHCTWLHIQTLHMEHPLCLIQKSLRTFQEEESVPGNWGLVWGLKQQTDTKRSSYFPSCTRLALSAILHESL